MPLALNDQPNNRPTQAFFLQNLDGGGAERAIIHLANEVARQGHAVDLVVGYANTDYRTEIGAQVNLVDFNSRSPAAVFSRLVVYLRHRQPLTIMSALDPANIMLILAAKFARFKGKQVLSQRAVLDASLRDLGAVRRWVTRALICACFPHADALISNSRAAARELNQRLGIPDDKIFTIHNAIDMARILRMASEPLVGDALDSQRAPLVLSVGSLTQRKDMSTLIHAFHQVAAQRSAQLLIIGKGPEKDRLKALVDDLGLSHVVHWLGFDPNPYRWMAAASVFVSSSTEEGFPNVIAEALALNCPVVATDCPGDTAELLGHGRWGRLVPVGDSKQMAEAIVATLDDPGPHALSARAADFSPAANAAAYLRVLSRR